MAMPTTAASPHATPAPEPGMCLLHADYHPMDDRCWGVTFDWWLEHQHLTEADRRSAYALEVEQAMLAALLPSVWPATTRKAGR